MFIGIDVSKDRLDAASYPTVQGWAFPNDPKGVSALIEKLQVQAPTLVVLEATGGLEIPVAGALWDVELPVVVINPRHGTLPGPPEGWPRPTR